MAIKKLTANDPETQSPDLMAENLAQLKALFPELVTEGKAGASVNVDVLKALVGDKTVSDAEEKYGLNWHGKRQARQLALTPSTGTLRPCPAESVNWDTTQNMMIEGDNLEVLKLLQKSYAGQVKIIYIDPPYNTGSDFVYPDNFQDNIKNYLELTGQTGEGGNKLSSNTEASGRFHTDWLNMMYPRLKLAQNLLKKDGVIFISIDDHEMDNLRLTCDEIFGEENFIVSLFWEKGRKNDSKLFSCGHDYMLVYAKSKALLTELKIRWRETKPGAAEIQDEYMRLKGLHNGECSAVQKGLREFYALLPKNHPSKKLSRYSNVDERGVWRDDNMSWPGGGGPSYAVLHPTTKLPCKVPEGGWRYSTLAKMNEMITAGRVMFRKDHTEPPIRKTYLVRGDGDETQEDLDDLDDDDAGIQVAGSYFYRSALQASNLMLDLFGEKVFDSPKDHEVLGRWFSYVCGSEKDAIIVDFFAGSGTTGHAVMAQNASDGSNHRFLLVQLPEPLAPESKDQKAAATFCDKLKKPRTIAELTKERLRRAGTKIRTEWETQQKLREDATARSKELKHPELFSAVEPLRDSMISRDTVQLPDLGFRVFKLASSNIQAWDPDSAKLADTLEASVEHLKTDRTENDILFELLLKLGLDLTVAIEEKAIAGKKVQSVGAGTLLVCLAPKISRKDAEPLALGMAAWHKELAPAGECTVVFKDSAFADDVAKTNLAAILEQHGLGNVRSL